MFNNILNTSNEKSIAQTRNDESFNFNKFQTYISTNNELNEDRKFVHEKKYQHLNTNIPKKQDNRSNSNIQYYRFNKNIKNNNELKMSSNKYPDYNSFKYNKSYQIHKNFDINFQTNNYDYLNLLNSNTLTTEVDFYKKYNSSKNNESTSERQGSYSINGTSYDTNDGLRPEKSIGGESVSSKEKNSNRFEILNDYRISSNYSSYKKNSNVNKNKYMKYKYDNTQHFNSIKKRIMHKNNKEGTGNGYIKKKIDAMSECNTIILNDFNNALYLKTTSVNQCTLSDINSNTYEHFISPDFYAPNKNKKTITSFEKLRTKNNNFQVNFLKKNFNESTDNESRNNQNNTMNRNCSEFNVNNDMVKKNNYNVYNRNFTKNDFNEKNMNNFEYKNNKATTNKSDNDENVIKLFFGNLAPITTEIDMLTLFSQFGKCSSLIILKDRKSKSRGSGFVTFYDKNEAIDAIKNLNNKITLPGAHKPLEVRFPENKKEKEIRTKLLTEAKSTGAKIPPSGYLLVDTDEVLSKKKDIGSEENILNDFNENDFKCMLTNDVSEYYNNNNNNDIFKSNPLNIKYNFRKNILYDNYYETNDKKEGSINTDYYCKMDEDILKKKYSLTLIEKGNYKENNVNLSKEECDVLLPKFLIDVISGKNNSSDNLYLTIHENKKLKTSACENEIDNNINDLTKNTDSGESKIEELIQNNEYYTNISSNMNNENNIIDKNETSLGSKLQFMNSFKSDNYFEDKCIIKNLNASENNARFADESKLFNFASINTNEYLSNILDIQEDFYNIKDLYEKNELEENIDNNLKMYNEFSILNQQNLESDIINLINNNENIESICSFNKVDNINKKENEHANKNENDQENENKHENEQENKNKNEQENKNKNEQENEKEFESEYNKTIIEKKKFKSLSTPLRTKQLSLGDNIIIKSKNYKNIKKKKGVTLDEMLTSIINLYAKNKSSIYSSHISGYLKTILRELYNCLLFLDEINAEKNKLKGKENEE